MWRGIVRTRNQAPARATDKSSAPTSTPRCRVSRLSFQIGVGRCMECSFVSIGWRSHGRLFHRIGLPPVVARGRRVVASNAPSDRHAKCRAVASNQGATMLEKLPDALGHALRGQRAGLDKIAFQAVDLRAGMASITVTSLAFVDHAPIPARYTADGAGVSPPLQWHRRAARRRLAGADRRGRRCADAAAAGARDRRRPRRRRRQRRAGGRCAVERGRRQRPSFASAATRTCRPAGCRPIRRPAMACIATRSRCSRSRPARRSTARRVATPCSRRSASTAWRAAA